jgi:signal transduction histidine kinase
LGGKNGGSGAPSGGALKAFAARYDFHSLAAATFSSPEAWSGRLLLLDPQWGADSEAELIFLQRLADEASSAVQNVFLLRRLRSRAGALERSRIARELHDGAIQSLLAAEMEVQVLRHRAAINPDAIGEQLKTIQELLHRQALGLRDVMELMKPHDFRPDELLAVLADLLEKFQRETAISAHFVCSLSDVRLAPEICRELVRIVQEGIFNVRKHSGAKNVLVQLGANNGKWQLDISDDGRGFDFSGLLSHTQLEASRKGPRVLRERERSIGGELKIESTPGHGAHLEITFPRENQSD